MSAQAESSLPAPTRTFLGSRRWAAVDRAMAWAGDRLNPILIKETRQALKSRQFTITFALLLTCGWAWSILGVAWAGPGIYYNAQGPDLFIGYYFILAVALFVIVPFGAFRSLAAEQEDRTYELMSITTLEPRMIVRGKLGSAVVQMLIYLSAISPCLAFTYMLRGIDFPSILFILFYTVLGSLALSLIGLLLATLTTERHWQVVLSVVLIAGLLLAGWIAIALTSIYLTWPDIPFADPEFWQVMGGIVTAYASYFLLVFYAAAAQLTFESDNRSTRLRLVMAAQQVLFIGWMTWIWIGPAGGDEDVMMVFMIFAGLHWYVMGALMSGESPELSPRVKRQLPQSFLGRVLLTWFNPGPGTGYMLTVSSLAAALLMVLAAAFSADLLSNSFSSLRRWSSDDLAQMIAFGALGLSYIAIYVGVGLLLIRLLRGFIYVGVMLAALVQILLLLAGILIPTVIQGISPSLRYEGYTLLHVLNPLQSLIQVGERSSLPPEAPVLLVVVPAIALIVFVLNLPSVVREVRHVRIARPQRVADEDAQLAAEKRPPQAPQPISPWD